VQDCGFRVYRRGVLQVTSKILSNIQSGYWAQILTMNTPNVN